MPSVKNAMADLSYPETRAKRVAAAKDPLTPEPLLRKIYELHGDGFFEMEALASNPSLPLDMLHRMLGSTRAPVALRSPNISIDDIKYLIHLSFKNEISELVGFSSTLEIFDWFVQLPPREPFSAEHVESIWFAPALLRASEATVEEYMGRVAKFSDKSDVYEAMEDKRFDLSSVTLPVGPVEALSIIVNPNANPELLVSLINTPLAVSVLDIKPLDNLNYPIQLSAQYHLSKMESYRWSPSYLLNLEAKVDEYLAAISGADYWAELPLAWKLKSVAE